MVVAKYKTTLALWRNCVEILKKLAENEAMQSAFNKQKAMRDVALRIRNKGIK